MNKKPFLAGQWFGNFAPEQSTNMGQAVNSDTNPSSMLRQEIENNRSIALRSFLPSFSPKLKSNSLISSIVAPDFQPAQHFLNGWHGDNLLSKSALKYRKIIAKIFEDAKDKFLNHSTFTRSIKHNIFDEFLLFAQSKALNFTEIDNTAALFQHIDNPLPPYESELKNFINLFCYRISVIYFLKLRLINYIALNKGINLQLSNIRNPGSFVNSYFKKGSSSELHGQAFAQSIFSWYRPNEDIAQILLNEIQITRDLSISEIIKNTSELTQIKDHAQFSHALSHKNFGLFLNGLLLNFPLWLDATNKSINDLQIYGTKIDMEVISCKYIGDFLESLSVSHWLAQDNNKELKWDHVLCPNFQGNEFETGQFFGLFNEIQFMTFMIQFANIHHLDGVCFLSEITKKHIKNNNDIGKQNNLWLTPERSAISTFDRVVLNLNNFPKNNPNHYLYNQIVENEKRVKDGGYLFVLSDKKLFVPSLKEKVEILLQTFNLECCISLDEVTGRGEVPSYIYILRKKYPLEAAQEQTKQHCLNFRLEGDLDTFQDFFHFADELQNFFANNLTERPVMYSRQFANSFSLELFQDAIVDGRLMRSSKKDSSSITHPSFFKNLLSSCIPFDTFFDVGTLNDAKSDINTLPGFQLEHVDHYPFICIIDKRYKTNVKIEIINIDSYEAKVQQYGVTQCHFFGIRPKLHQINLNLFREFFESRLGSQIINITFEGTSKKIKSKLNSMLIPNFFLNNKPIPEHIIKGFTLLSMPVSEILTIHPEDLKQKYSYMESFLPSILKNFPSHTFGMLAFFKNNLKTILESNIAKLDQISFKNPIICRELVKEESFNIYPENQEVYIDFNVGDVSLLKLPMTSYQLHKDGEIYSIQIKSNENLIITLNCPEQIAMLLDVILSNLKNIPINQLLTGIKVPTNNRLKAVLENQEQITSSFRDIYNSVQNNLDKILTNLINQKTN